MLRNSHRLGGFKVRLFVQLFPTSIALSLHWFSYSSFILRQ